MSHYLRELANVFASAICARDALITSWRVVWGIVKGSAYRAKVDPIPQTKAPALTACKGAWIVTMSSEVLFGPREGRESCARICICILATQTHA